MIQWGRENISIRLKRMPISLWQNLLVLKQTRIQELLIC